MDNIEGSEEVRAENLEEAVKVLALYNKEVYADAKSAIAEKNLPKFVSICKKVNIDEETANKVYTVSTTTALSW